MYALNVQFNINIQNNKHTFIMSKKQTKGILSRKDLVGIARIANLSESTLVKWYDKKLAVKPETEFRIFEAARLFYTEETLKLNNYLLGLSEIEQRISETKNSLEEAILVMEKGMD